MACYGVETKLNPEKVIKEATAYFGKGGLGLREGERDPCCAYFEGGGGFVRVTASEEETHTTVNLETREWDYHVRAFIQEIV